MKIQSDLSVPICLPRISKSLDEDISALEKFASIKDAKKIVRLYLKDNVHFVKQTITLTSGLIKETEFTVGKRLHELTSACYTSGVTAINDSPELKPTPDFKVSGSVKRVNSSVCSIAISEDISERIKNLDHVLDNKNYDVFLKVYGTGKVCLVVFDKSVVLSLVVGFSLYWGVEKNTFRVWLNLPRNELKYMLSQKVLEVEKILGGYYLRTDNGIAYGAPSVPLSLLGICEHTISWGNCYGGSRTGVLFIRRGHQGNNPINILATRVYSGDGDGKYKSIICTMMVRKPSGSTVKHIAKILLNSHRYNFCKSLYLRDDLVYLLFGENKILSQQETKKLGCSIQVVPFFVSLSVRGENVVITLKKDNIFSVSVHSKLTETVTLDPSVELE
jgi:hypothetical protein